MNERKREVFAEFLYSSVYGVTCNHHCSSILDTLKKIAMKCGGVLPCWNSFKYGSAHYGVYVESCFHIKSAAVEYRKDLHEAGESSLGCGFQVLLEGQSFPRPR